MGGCLKKQKIKEFIKRKLNQTLSDYGDVVPRVKYEELSVQHATVRETLTTHVEEYNQLQGQYMVIKDRLKDADNENAMLYSKLRRMKGTATPRPEWDRCIPNVENWEKMSEGASSERRVDMLIARLAGLTVEQKRDSDVFQTMGASDTVPEFLRTEADYVKNIHMIRKEFLRIYRQTDYWLYRMDVMIREKDKNYMASIFKKSAKKPLITQDQENLLKEFNEAIDKLQTIDLTTSKSENNFDLKAYYENHKFLEELTSAILNSSTPIKDIQPQPVHDISIECEDNVSESSQKDNISESSQKENQRKQTKYYTELIRLLIKDRDYWKKNANKYYEEAKKLRGFKEALERSTFSYHHRMGVIKTTIRLGDEKTFPKKGQKLLLHYTGTLENGEKFDSSRDRGKPFEFTIGIGEVIKGWDEGIIQMSVGERATLIIFPEYGYGSQSGSNAIPPNSVLIFDVELFEIK